MTWSEHHAKALDSVFHSLNRSGIPWLVLRNHQGLPWHNPAQDVDIGIEQNKLRKAEMVVEKALKSHGFNRKETTVFQWGRCTSYFGVADKTAVSIKIDLMDGFSWRAAGLFNSRRLLSRAVRHDNFLIPDPTDDATIMWLKPLMTGGFVKQAYVNDLTDAIMANPKGFQNNLGELFSDDLAALAWDDLENSRYEELAVLHKRFSWNAWMRHAAEMPLATSKNAISYLTLELWRRTHRPKASLLAIVGPNNETKTAFITELQSQLADLQAKEQKSIELVDFWPYDIRSKDQNQYTGFLRFFLLFWRDYLTHIHKRCVSGKTIIFIDYINDVMINPQCKPKNMPFWPAKILVAAFPRPDLVFMLPSHPIGNLESRNASDKKNPLDWKDLHAIHPSKLVSLDSTLDPKENARFALTEIVKRIYKKF